MKKKSIFRLFIILLFTIAGIIFWGYKTFGLTVKMGKIADVTENSARVQMDHSKYLKFQYSTAANRAIATTSIWLATCYGFMIAICVLVIYEEIKTFRKPIHSRNGETPEEMIVVMQNNSKMTIDFNIIHSKCGWHEEDIIKSKVCGCFYCLSIFCPIEIKEWIEEPDHCRRGPGKTAICPRCGIDSVLPDNIGHDITVEFLKLMQNKYF